MVHNYFLMTGMIQFLQSVMHESHLAYVEEKILLQWKVAIPLTFENASRLFCVYFYMRDFDFPFSKFFLLALLLLVVIMYFFLSEIYFH
jgi:hypothetical protein